MPGKHRISAWIAVAALLGLAWASERPGGRSVIAIGFVGLALVFVLSRLRDAWRGAGLRRSLARIDDWRFPEPVQAQARGTILQACPDLGEQQMVLVCDGLRQYFRANLLARGASLAMPSKAVDALWHAFILDTRSYSAFCRVVFGGYFHHVPEGAGGGGDRTALARTWRLAMRTDPGLAPGQAPLLFRIDRELGWPGAIAYTAAHFGAVPEGTGSCSGNAGGDCLGGGTDARNSPGHAPSSQAHAHRGHDGGGDPHQAGESGLQGGGHDGSHGGGDSGSHGCSGGSCSGCSGGGGSD